MLVGIEVEKKVVRLVHDFINACVGTIDLVDHQNHGQSKFERLAQHEPCLRQWAFTRVDEQQHRVDHGERAFYFAAKVGVARGIDDVDLDAMPID